MIDRSFRESLIDGDDLRETFHYDQNTGNFYVKKRRRGMKKPVGGIATTQLPNGYLRLSFLAQGFMAHRIAWFFVHGRFPAHDIDHINGNPSDNRIANLREATRGQNLHNSKLDKKNTTGFKGVRRHYAVPGKPYFASINVNRKQVFLGLFSTKEAAAAAYDVAAVQHLGEFARTNANLRGT
jgi:hypothetical protein